MKNKIKTCLFALIIIGVITLCLTYKSKNNITETKKKKQSNIAIMIKEDGANDYTRSSSKDIPKGDYVLNKDKSYCKNNGKIGNYDSSLGKVSFSFIGTDSCYLYFDYYFEPGYITILKNNGGKEAIESKGTPDFSVVATTNEGMYASEDDLGTSYYFRGAVDNNWLKYGKYTKDLYNCNDGTLSETDTGNSCTKIASTGDDMYWRIIRINGDNSIRMIYWGIAAPLEDTKVVMSSSLSLGKSTFNKNYNGAESAGYKYTIGEQYGLETDSTIKIFLDDWYANYTNLNANGTKITDQIFCNDRSPAATQTADWASTGAEYSYGVGDRIAHDDKPTIKCPMDSDRFTVNKINFVGNSALKYPVGLITADEVEMAGRRFNLNFSEESNEKYYLYTSKAYWTSTPISFVGEDNKVMFIHTGELVFAYNTGIVGVRPVVSLSSNVKLSGDGTWNNIYKVE